VYQERGVPMPPGEGFRSVLAESGENGTSAT